MLSYLQCYSLSVQPPSSCRSVISKWQMDLEEGAKGREPIRTMFSACEVKSKPLWMCPNLPLYFIALHSSFNAYLGSYVPGLLNGFCYPWCTWMIYVLVPLPMCFLCLNNAMASLPSTGSTYNLVPENSTIRLLPNKWLLHFWLYFFLQFFISLSCAHVSFDK